MGRSTFEVAHEGWVFTTGRRGTGYYRDDYGESAVACAAQLQHAQWLDKFGYLFGLSPPHEDAAVRSGVFVLPLAELLPSDGGVAGFGARRRPRGVPRRRCGRPVRGRRRPAEELRRGSLAAPPPWIQAAELGVAKADSRHRALGAWAVDTYNGNAASSMLDYLDATAADLCMLQETRVRGDRLLSMQRQARRAGWSMGAEPARLTEAGACSAGTAVAARRHVGHTVTAGCGGGAVLQGRWRPAPGAGVCWGGGGIHCLSAYFWCSEGASPRNLELLQAIAQTIRALRGPWLLAADFNMEPQLLASTGWLELVQGTVWAPQFPTCNQRVYDYFVADRRLDHAVLGVAVVSDTGGFPHSAVRLWLRGAPRRDRVRVLCTPLKASADLPAGCIGPCAAGMGWDAIAATDPGQLPPAAAQRALDAGFATWMGLVEHSLACTLGLSDHQRKRFYTRQLGP